MNLGGGVGLYVCVRVCVLACACVCVLACALVFFWLCSILCSYVQDEPMDGCGDGEWRGQRRFSSPPGRGFFCPVFYLRLDERLMSYRTATGGGHPGNRMSHIFPR